MSTDDRRTQAPDDFGRVSETNSLSNALAVLRRRWMIIAAVVAACVAVAVVHEKRSAKSYTAAANVAFQSATLSDVALQVSSSGGNEPQREANTEVLVAHSPEVAAAARAQLHVPAETQELLNQVEIEAAPNADILNVIASTGDPRYSVRLANAFAEQYIAFKQRSQLAGIATAEHKLQEQLAALPAGSAERATLQQTLERMGELRAVAGGGASIIGRASQAKLVNKPLSTTVVIGLVIGLAIAFSIVFLLESLDRRIKSIEEFELEYRLPALAAVPQSSFRMHRAVDRDQLEPYRILRSALDIAAVTRQLDTLLVTSAGSGEGKTTVAVDLAHAVALAGRRVALIELDLRRPTFAEHFGLDTHSGLTTALARSAPLAELMVEPFPDLPNLSVLPAGLIPHNPSELLGSPGMAEIIAELAASENMVIIDAPPLNPVADTQVLLNNSAIHGTILVARVGQATRDQVRRARMILNRHMVEPVGIVVTGLHDAERYGYGFYRGEDRELETNGGSSRASSRPVRERLPG
jgi:succinoglycan biosynthesis transport protein ExoP